jgi:hypothetical protein
MTELALWRMGADVIYTYRKLLPRMLVILVLLSGSAFVPFVFNLPPWAPLWFVADFALVFTYIALEFYHASRLVTGRIEDVAISDLGKAIYWLSIVGSRKVPSGQEFRYYGNVTKVADGIGGNLKLEWQEVLRKSHLPNPITSICLLIGIFICLSGIVLALFLSIEPLTWIIFVPMAILFIVFSNTHKKGREGVESLIKSVESTQTACRLAQELISWVSPRISRPLKVMLAEDVYSQVSIVGTIFGSSVAEIQPEARIVESGVSRELASTPAPKEYKPITVRQEKWEPLWMTLIVIGFVVSLILLEVAVPFLNWVYQLSYSVAGDVLTLIAAIVVVSLPFVPIELFFRRKHLASSIPVLIIVLFVFLAVPILEWAGLSERMAWRTFLSTSMIVVIALSAALLYFGWPFLRIIFRGGVVKPSDLEEVVRRFPATVIRRMIKQEGQVKERLEFLIALHSKGFIAMSEVPESIREWINEDARQPPSLRYFSLTQDSVSLTELSKPLAKALQKKLGPSTK